MTAEHIAKVFSGKLPGVHHGRQQARNHRLNEEEPQADRPVLFLYGAAGFWKPFDPSVQVRPSPPIHGITGAQQDGLCHRHDYLGKLVTAIQLELFRPVYHCGRREVPCELVEERSSTGTRMWRCLSCGSIAPITTAASK